LHRLCGHADEPNHVGGILRVWRGHRKRSAFLADVDARQGANAAAYACKPPYPSSET
jgi:hypothetical protein